MSFLGLTGLMFPGKLLAGFFLVSVMSLSNALSHDNLNVTHYGPEDGLSQISVNTIFQDFRGFLWIGTRDGLNRFDGYRFKVFRHQPSDNRSLSNSNIQSIVEDNSGNLWVGTLDGLNLFKQGEESFRVYRNQIDTPLNAGYYRVNSVFVDSEGIIWLVTASGLDRFDPESETFRSYGLFSGGTGSDDGLICSSPLEDSKKRLWVGSNDGLFYLDKGSDQFAVYVNDPSDNTSISSNRVGSVYETSDGTLLIGTDKGLNIFDPDLNTFSRFYIEQESNADPVQNSVTSIFEGSAGKLWIGTGSGLFLFSTGSGDFKPLSIGPGSEPFSGRKVSSITEDSAGNIWVGSPEGLHMIDSKNKFSRYRVRDYLHDAPQLADRVSSLFYGENDELWLGTAGGGLVILNRKKGSFRHFSTRSASVSQRLPDDFIDVIHSGSNGRILLGTREGLLVSRDNGTTFAPYCPTGRQQDCMLLNRTRINSVYEDSETGLWIGTGNGLHLVSGDSLTSYFHNPVDRLSLSSNNVHDVIECDDGFIWAATDNGLNRLDKVSGEFSVFRKNPEMGRFSLSSNYLTTLYLDSGGNLWIGSDAGLNRFFSTTGSFMVFSELEGLPNNFINAISEDSEANLWISTNRGLTRLNTETFEAKGFGPDDGLQCYEFMANSGFRSAAGELFFGGINGVNAFFPDSLKANTRIPPVAITAFRVTNAGIGRVINVGQKDKIVLGPKENSINIEFAALDFSRPYMNRYAYIMEGLEDTWTDAGNRRMANYSRVPPGRYVFKVIGSNNDGIWNREGFSVNIVIIAPFWRSVYAYVFYILLFAGLVYAIVLFSTMNLRKINLVLRDKEIASAEISIQKEDLALKNRSITDSINYAKRIQLAMMPTSKLFRQLFPESFVLYKPKDIVSGDFYWVNQRNEKVFFAVIDCTGHGVPGAFMSIIGYELLRNIINVKGIEKPSDILNILSDDFTKIFHSENNEDFSFRDGMDIGFCVIDKKHNILEFAGAFTPLYLVRDNSIIEIKGNRFSVGIMEDLVDERFENHSIDLEKNDIIYLFSDGYSDQFGGEEGKKFKYRRFRHLLLNIHSLPVAEQERLLDQSIIQWMGDNEQVDDILVIGVKP